MAKLNSKEIMETVDILGDAYDAAYNYDTVTNLAVVDFSSDDDSIKILKEKIYKLTKDKNNIIQEILDTKEYLKDKKTKEVIRLNKIIEKQKKITREYYNKLLKVGYRGRVYTTKGSAADKRMSEYIKTYPNLLIANSYYENAKDKTFEIWRLPKNSNMSIKEFSILVDLYLSNRKYLKVLYREIDKARHLPITKDEKIQKLNKKLSTIIDEITDLEMELEFLQ